MIEPTVITGPIAEPVSIEEAKAQCRISSSNEDEDKPIRIFISAAREYLEWRTGTTIHDTTLEYVLDNWPATNYIELPRASPLIAITSVYEKDSDGIETLWDSDEYSADIDSRPGRLVLGYNESWPSFTHHPVSPIRIRYRTGIATSATQVEATEAVKYPILLLVTGMWENRESESISDRGMLSKISADYGVEAFINRLTPQYVF